MSHFSTNFQFPYDSKESMDNLNENPREGFAIVSACTDTWREMMSSRCNSQDERLLKLEHSILAMNNAVQGSHSLFLGLYPFDNLDSSSKF